MSIARETISSVAETNLAKKLRKPTFISFLFSSRVKKHGVVYREGCLKPILETALIAAVLSVDIYSAGGDNIRAGRNVFDVTARGICNTV